MATDIGAFVRELRSFDDRRVLVKSLRRAIRKPVPAVRERIRKHAVEILPRSGGLGAWAAASTVSVSIRYASARTAGVRMRGSRKSAQDKSDLNRLDAGSVRAPSWGRRSRGAWHVQTVTPGWFSDPVTGADEWLAAVDAAVDAAFDTIRRG